MESDNGRVVALGEGVLTVASVSCVVAVGSAGENFVDVGDVGVACRCLCAFDRRSGSGMFEGSTVLLTVVRRARNGKSKVGGRVQRLSTKDCRIDLASILLAQSSD